MSRNYLVRIVLLDNDIDLCSPSVAKHLDICFDPFLLSDVCSSALSRYVKSLLIQDLTIPSGTQARYFLRRDCLAGNLPHRTSRNFLGCRVSGIIAVSSWTAVSNDEHHCFLQSLGSVLALDGGNCDILLQTFRPSMTDLHFYIPVNQYLKEMEDRAALEKAPTSASSLAHPVPHFEARHQHPGLHSRALSTPGRLWAHGQQGTVDRVGTHERTALLSRRHSYVDTTELDDDEDRMKTTGEGPVAGGTIMYICLSLMLLMCLTDRYPSSSYSGVSTTLPSSSHNLLYGSSGLR